MIWNQSNEILKGKIDLNNIGFVGHLFGAIASIVIAVMKPAFD